MAIELELGTALAGVGAGVAIGFASFGSAFGQGIAAASSVGAISQDNDMFARGLIFTVLMETQAIYGFLIAILLMVSTGFLGGEPASLLQGGAALGAGLAIGFAAFGSALGQGIAAASSVGVLVEDSDMFARALIFTVLMETQAIYGFLIAILLMVGASIL